MRSHLFVVDLSACAYNVLFRMSFPVLISLRLFPTYSQVYCILSCVEVPREYLLELKDWAKAMSVEERLEGEYLFDPLAMGLGEGRLQPVVCYRAGHKTRGFVFDELMAEPTCVLTRGACGLSGILTISY